MRRDQLPKYQAVALDLDTRLVNGEWRPGALLPSEQTLAQGYSVSRITVRNALSLLELQGRVARRQGRAAQVTTKVLRHVVPVIPFEIDMKAQGVGFRKQIEQFRLAVVPAEIRRELDIEANRALFIREIRYIDGVPYSFADRYLNPRVAKTLVRKDLEAWPLYQLLPEVAGRQAEFEMTMDVRSCQPFEAEVLKIKSVSLVFVYHSRCHLPRGSVFEVLNAYYPLDRWRFVIQARSNLPRSVYRVPVAVGQA